MLDVEDAEVAGDVNRRATARGATALLPTRLMAVEHHAFGAVYQPAVLTVPLTEVLPDLPTVAHSSPLQ